MKKTKKVPIEIPSKAVYKAYRGNNCYVFHIEYISKNKQRLISIGKVDDKDTNMMLPNDNYKLFYESDFEVLNQPNDYFNDRLKIGAYCLVRHILDKIGCMNVLEKVFQADAKKILAYSLFQIIEKSSSSQLFEYFAYDNYVGLSKNLYANEFTPLFKERITFDKIDEFNRLWVKAWKKLLDYPECETIIYLDSTNHTTASRDNDNAEYGKAKKNDGFPQVNTALFYSKEASLPLAIKQYRGSVIDNSTIKELHRYAKMIGLDKGIFVLDRGYHSENNVKILSKSKFALMCSERTNTTIKTILANKGINYNSMNWVEGYNAYCEVYDREDFYGIKLRIFTFIDNDTKNIETANLHERILAEENMLKTKLKYEDWMKNYHYFHIKKTRKVKGKPNFTFSRNLEAIQESIDKCGAFVVITNDFSFTKESMLKTIRDKNEVELPFKYVKTSFDCEKLRVYSDASYLGKTFNAFLSSIIKCALLKELSPYLKKKGNSSQTFNTVLATINKIEVSYEKSKFVPHYNLTARQLDILKCCNVSSDYLLKIIEEINKNIKL